METLIHTTRQVVEEAQAQGEERDDLMILGGDLINNYNMVDRNEAFKEIEERTTQKC